MMLNLRKLLGSAATFIAEPTDDQGVAIGRSPQVLNDVSMLTLAASTDSGWKTLDLTQYWYQYNTLVLGFSGLAAPLAEFEGMFSDDSGGTTNPRPMNVRQTAFNPKILTTELTAGVSFEVIPLSRYFRYRVKNGTTAQTAFRLHGVALDLRG